MRKVLTAGPPLSGSISARYRTSGARTGVVCSSERNQALECGPMPEPLHDRVLAKLGQPARWGPSSSAVWTVAGFIGASERDLIRKRTRAGLAAVAAWRRRCGHGSATTEETCARPSEPPRAIRMEGLDRSGLRLRFPAGGASSSGSRRARFATGNRKRGASWLLGGASPPCDRMEVKQCQRWPVPHRKATAQKEPPFMATLGGWARSWGPAIPS
jgi:hypothetical protein